MQARANFFEIKIIATLRKEQQFLFIFYISKIVTSPDFIGDF